MQRLAPLLALSMFQDAHRLLRWWTVVGGSNRHLAAIKTALSLKLPR